jgi:F0F1-type ATP synthase delta subunit
MEHAYAQALWEMAKGGMDGKKAVHALRELLIRTGREALLPRIGLVFARIAERESKKHAVTLSIARESDERTAHREAKKVLSEMGVETKNLKTHIDGTLVGGWRLDGGEILIDNSYKKKLLSMYNRVVSV